MPYNAPVDQIAHTLRTAGRLDELAATGAFPNFDADLVAPILDEANKLARDVLAPLNPIGHKSGAKLENGGVVAAPGFSDAYAKFREGGWMGLAFPEEFGGQGLPKVLALAVMEMVHGANMAFGLCPLLTFGAIEALIAHGTDEQKTIYLPKLISGEWTGAMNLTEPQAGSDVGALKTRATPNGDGSYSIDGQKIFITWGDHDMTDNVVQLVLARLPDAPAGSKGVSLFVAPKFLVNADGSLGARNGVRCIGLEHKMGIHASPTSRPGICRAYFARVANRPTYGPPKDNGTPNDCPSATTMSAPQAPGDFNNPSEIASVIPTINKAPFAWAASASAVRFSTQPKKFGD
jgi:alkylation response protein AidB-like acyl-CoA dehydrogenase